MAKIKFYRGLEASYNQGTHADGLFFATDTHKIFLNGAAYGGQDLGVDKVVSNVEIDPEDPNKIKVTFNDASTSSIELPEADLTYTSKIEDKNLTMPEKVGGIAKGTKVSALEGKTQNELWDDLLFPTVNPTYVNPSASLSLKGGYAATVEAGVAGPDFTDNFTTGFNKGAINLNGTKQADRAGDLDASNSFIFVNDDPENKTTPAKIALGNTTFKYRAAYQAGPQPKDNKGNNVGTPLAAGHVDSSAVTVNGTYPWYATTTNSTDLTKQALIAWNNTAGQMTTPRFTVAAMGSGKQEFKLPRKCTQLQMLNTVSNQMEVISLDAWTETTNQEDVNGNSVTYYIYTYNGAVRGAVTLIAKF